MKKTSILLPVLLFGFLICVAQEKYEANWQSIDNRPVPAWFEDAKFGIFIHWGLYSVPSWTPVDPENVYENYAEWYWHRYMNGKLDESNPNNAAVVKFHTENYGENFQNQDFVPDFKAELFQPDKWAEIIKNSGAKYVVLTSKHHDGFALWQSAQSWNWNSVDVGPHRDFCGELSQSVKKQGLKMGFYYSLYEWYNPLYKENVDKYVDEHMMPQMKDLVVRYEPDIFWTDGEWEHNSDVWKSPQFLAWLFNESPVKANVVVNDRWGKETRTKHGGMFTTEYDYTGSGNVGGSLFDRPWEDCRGMSGSFGFNRNEDLKNYATSQELIKTLIDKVARGGNLLLNIGPSADGRIPVIFQQRLADIGNWLSVNGDAIYGTKRWEKSPPITSETSLFFTEKGDAIYAILTEWEDEIIIENISKVSNVQMLGYNGDIQYSHSGNRLKIKLPLLTPNRIPCQYAWAFRIL